MASSIDDANPSDETVERSIKEERRFLDRKKYSIVPPGIQGSGLDGEGEEARDMENVEARDITEEDYEDLSSDKEEGTTEGEITDTHTSD